jgi:ABC-type transport system involved in multi-copper enzyme maturation permease subunit
MNAVVIAETVRRHLISIAYWSFVALLVIVAFGTARFNTPAAMWPSLITLLSIVAGSAPIGPEFSSGTLQLILVKPLTRSAYLLSRVAGVVLVVWLAASVAAGAELLGRALLVPKLSAAQIGSALVHAGAESVLTVSLLTLFGSLTRAYFNAAIIVVLQMALGIGEGVAAFAKQPVVARTLSIVTANLFPDAPVSLSGRWILIALSNAAVALVFACLFFRRREVPYGAD